MVAILKSNFGSSRIFIREVKPGKSKLQFRVEVISRKPDSKAGGYWNKNSPTAGSTHRKTNSIKKTCLERCDDPVTDSVEMCGVRWWGKVILMVTEKSDYLPWSMLRNIGSYHVYFKDMSKTQRDSMFSPLVLWTGVQNGGVKRNGKGMVHSKGECIFLYWYMKASGYLSDVLHRYDRNTEKASPGRKSSAQLRFQGIDTMTGKLRQQELNNQEISIQGGMNSFCWLVVFILYNTIQDSPAQGTVAPTVGRSFPLN